MKVKFKDCDCRAVFSIYSNGNTSIQLVEDGGIFNGMPVATASVNMGVALMPELVAIKSYSDNNGIDNALIDAGIIAPELIYAHPAYANFSVYRLSDSALIFAKKQGFFSMKPLFFAEMQTGKPRSLFTTLSLIERITNLAFITIWRLNRPLIMGTPVLSMYLMKTKRLLNNCPAFYFLPEFLVR